MCGGPIHARSGRIGKTAAKMYMCGYFHDRAACQNSLRRPVEEADAGCIEWIKANVLREEVILEIFRELRERLTQSHKGTEGELEELEAKAAKLRKEIANLAEAVALTGGSVQALAQKLSDRQERLSGIEARTKLIKVAPGVLSLEVRRLEADVRQRLDRFRELLDGDREGARRIVEALLNGPATFTPIATPEGKRYRVAGRIATGALLQALPDPQRERPQGESNPTAPSVPNVAHRRENTGTQAPQSGGKHPEVLATADEPPGSSDEPPSPRSGDDAVEGAIATALSRAAAAGRFDVVAQLARELEARRERRAGNLVRLDAGRRGGPR